MLSFEVIVVDNKSVYATISVLTVYLVFNIFGTGFKGMKVITFFLPKLPHFNKNYFL